MSKKSFIEELDKEALEFFTDVNSQPFQSQAVSFLNAYWDEVGETHAEFIYSCSWDRMRYADMQARGISLVHLYEEGVDLDLDIGMYFYEQLVKHIEQNPNTWGDEKYAASHPEVLTAIKRKQEIREKVDVNFNGRISFLEVLLHQYREFANPADFTRRAMSNDEHPEVKRARLALEEVNKAIKAYEAERFRLEEGSKKPGVSGLQFKHSLAILDDSPLRTDLNEKLIRAEAAVRIAGRKFGGASGGGGDSSGSGGCGDRGAIWWMKRDLDEKKKRYSPQKKR